MTKTILFEGVRLYDFKGDTLEDECFNNVELSEAELATLTNIMNNNREELPLYELIELNTDEELKRKLMTCCDNNEKNTFLPIKAYF